MFCSVHYSRVQGRTREREKGVTMIYIHSHVWSYNALYVSIVDTFLRNWEFSSNELSAEV